MNGRSLDRQELLEAPSLRSEWCAVCGRTATNQHHVVPKGMGGTTEEGPTVSLCGHGNTSGCHRLAHGLGLTFRYGPSGWRFFANDEAAKDISKRRTPRIRAGLHDCLVSTPDAAPESVQDLHAIETALNELSGAEATIAYTQGLLLREARDYFIALHSGKREASARFREWFVDCMHKDKASVTRLTTFATLPERAADLGVTKGYYAARVVSEGLDTVDGAITNARTLSVSDLRALYWPATDKTERTLVCPDCGTVREASLFRKAD